ncbi:hypothetical protein N7478_010360 [Penicillium angulare]|uniref:uncharacterized protein n=1 Tax=Penicillium angulare TaxID=116970 RepID=UPI002541182D|nr:uncharacterized protein N7478_010360 [Penicillium angulare]KAJ5267552.1 hypothetical protein N7478_010360 [Penicillium angulare]
MTSTYPPQVTSGYTTTFIPLTTAWTAPEYCSTQYLGMNGTDGDLTYRAFDPFYHQYANTSATCNPSQILEPSGDDWTSLGPFICPGNWTSVAETLTEGSSTQTACCPSDYTANVVPNTDGYLDVDCISYAGGDMNLTYASYGLPTSNMAFITTFITDGWKLYADPASGWNIGPSTANATTTGSTTPTSTDVGKSTSTAGSEHRASGDDGAGRKAGIAVGVVVGVLAVLALFAFFIVRHRRSKRGLATGEDNKLPPGELSADPELFDPQEMSGKGLAELGGRHDRAELHHESVQELPG